MAAALACMRRLSVFCLFLFTFTSKDWVLGLNNGVARTPPMGWMIWERFRCNIDCDKDPNNCISEKVIMQMADHLVKDGYRDVGYEYVSIDDCWSNMERDSTGQLQPNSTRFPSGMKALADYLHARGLKLGMYADYGTKTCAGYPGSIFHMEQDAQTFASWGVDYLKVDGCNCDVKTMDVGYPKFTKAINVTGRPILLSYEWPYYWQARGYKVNYTLVADSCNTWRDYIDIQDSWDDVLKIVDYFAANQDTFAAVAGPGQWNDPDQLLVGDFGLSYEEQKAQFAFWSMFAAPLTMSNDLRSMPPEAKEILQNKEVIAVNQDKLGRMGRRVSNKNGLQVWSRPLMDDSVAALLFNPETNVPHVIDAAFDLIGISSGIARVRDLFAQKDLGVFNKSFSAKVNPSGVVMVKLTPIKL